MIIRLITIEEIDGLYLMWDDHISAPTLYRRALREEMDVHDVNPNELRELLGRAHHQGYTFEEIIENINQFVDLQSLVENRQDYPSTEDAIDE